MIVARRAGRRSGSLPVTISPSLAQMYFEGGLVRPSGAEGPVDHAGVVLAVGEDAELERPDVGHLRLDFLDLLGRRLRQDDLDPVAADLADRDVEHPLGVDPPLQGGDQLVEVEVGREVRPS